MSHRTIVRLVASATCACLCWFCALPCALASGKKTASLDDAKKLAGQIDQILAKRFKKERITPAPPAENAVYLRRIYLDLAGRIPTLLELRDFLDDDRADKRIMRVEKILASEESARHFANVWRSILISHRTDNNGNVLQMNNFEDWLYGQIRNNTGFDQIVRDLLTDQTTTNGSANLFFTANGQKPEQLASVTSRIFLGVRLECAQCHAHPFAKWTREEFWSMAAFFAQDKGNTTIADKRDLPALNIPGTKRTATARFLDGTKPRPFRGAEGRKVLADWMTSKKNPFFARAIVDHVWSYFFGLSLLEPIQKDEVGAITHPELLDTLAREFAEHDFDLKYLIRAIVYSQAYQRSSRGAAKDTAPIQFFARMPVRTLRPEQLYDSFMIATRGKQSKETVVPVNFAFGGPLTPRQQFLIKFADQGSQIEKQTSILQALYLMNGKFLSERIHHDKNPTVQILATQPTSHKRRLESLYLLVLSRRPRPAELRRLIPYLERGGVTGNRVDAIADVYWALLNSSEFLLNH